MPWVCFFFLGNMYKGSIVNGIDKSITFIENMIPTASIICNFKLALLEIVLYLISG